MLSESRKLGLFDNFDFAALRTRHEQICPGAVRDEAGLALFRNFNCTALGMEKGTRANWVCFYNPASFQDFKFSA